MTNNTPIRPYTLLLPVAMLCVYCETGFSQRASEQSAAEAGEDETTPSDKAAQKTSRKPAKENQPRDEKLIQGTWTVVSAYLHGRPLYSHYDRRWIVRQGSITIQKPDGSERWRVKFSLDSSAQLRQIDWIDVLDKKEVNTCLGVYRLDKSSLVVALSPNDDERPSRCDKQSSFICYALKRGDKPIDRMAIIRPKQRRAAKALQRFGARFDVDKHGHVTDVDIPKTCDDTDLASLVDFVKLQAVEIDRVRIKKVGLLHLGKLSGLKILRVSSSQITDKDVVHLAHLKNLESLNLISTRISDAGLMHLKKLTKLKELALGFTKITEAGLVHLEGMKHLEDLFIDGNGISDDAAQKLSDALPDTRIVY
ncbi:MAG: TIGR03067 domain-containing protein [Planctomycetes bacterium]|nr:TIGR03067 domain-containing protein [Planctomycetota bacterium]